MQPQLMTVSWTRKEILIAGFLNGIVMGSFGEAMHKEQSGKWDDWMAVNDGVMGGVSRSRPEVSSRDTLVFTGNLSLENNGGFASVRHVSEPFELDQGAGVLLRVKGDGKKYQFRVRTSDRFDGMAYKVDFITEKDEWQEFRFAWDAFVATYRGRTLQDAPLVKPLNIRQIGFLIADRQEGKFELEIGSIEAF